MCIPNHWFLASSKPQEIHFGTSSTRCWPWFWNAILLPKAAKRLRSPKEMAEQILWPGIGAEVPGLLNHFYTYIYI